MPTDPSTPVLSASQDEVGKRLGELSAKSTPGPWVAWNPPFSNSWFGNNRLGAVANITKVKGWEAVAEFVTELVNAYRSGALVPAPEPARGLAVTEANDAFIAKIKENVDRILEACMERQRQATEEHLANSPAGRAALRTSPPETVGGGDNTLSKAESIINRAAERIKTLEENDVQIVINIGEDRTNCHLHVPKSMKFPEAERRVRVAHDALGMEISERYKCPAALSSAPPAEETWQAIETAPKDGTLFWAIEPGRGQHRRQYICWHESGDGVTYWQDDADSEPEPTHWRPLPPSPAREAK